MLARAGRYLEIGNISPGKTLEIDPSVLVYHSKTIFGVVMYGSDTLKKALDFLSRTKHNTPSKRFSPIRTPWKRSTGRLRSRIRGLFPGLP